MPESESVIRELAEFLIEEMMASESLRMGSESLRMVSESLRT